jgi:cyanophycinase-like exopeptidase
MFMVSALSNFLGSRPFVVCPGILAITLLTLMAGQGAQAQPYESYRLGSSTDAITNPMGGLCLMGGATDNDDAIRWFLQRADGGDVLVLRTSGSDSYNDYFYTDMGVTLNSVETIVCQNPSASSEVYVQSRIQQAEAIWFAGGDQWEYISFWRGTAVDSLIRQGVRERNTVVGGTSAGMAIQGQYYFSAENGTVTSPAALANPYNNKVTVDSARFLAHPLMQQVITDTHFDNPDRRGRAMVFLARVFTDFDVPALAIASDEYTAVCIDTAGWARVFGAYPSYEDYAYFIQPNCALEELSPERCEPGEALTWNRDGLAVKVYQVPGTADGVVAFDLTTREALGGGTWQDWSAEEGTLTSRAGSEPACDAATSLDTENLAWQPTLFPGICSHELALNLPTGNAEPWHARCIGLEGRMHTSWTLPAGATHVLRVQDLNPGCYWLQLSQGSRQQVLRFVKVGG